MAKGYYLAILVLIIASSATTLAYSVSENGLNFIDEHEGTRYSLYNDPAGHCTIGIGHLVHSGNCDGSNPSEQGFLRGITNDQALELLRSDAKNVEEAVNTYVTIPLNQNHLKLLLVLLIIWDQVISGIPVVYVPHRIGALNFSNSFRFHT
jgi:hypothetical protein